MNQLIPVGAHNPALVRAVGANYAALVSKLKAMWKAYYLQPSPRPTSGSSRHR